MTENISMCRHSRPGDGTMGAERESSRPGQRNGEQGEREEEKRSAMERETQTRCWPSGLDGESAEKKVESGRVSEKKER